MGKARFWPEHWFWYALLGFVVGLGVGHVTGTVFQLYVPEGPVAEHLRDELLRKVGQDA